MRTCRIMTLLFFVLACLLLPATASAVPGRAPYDNFVLTELAVAQVAGESMASFLVSKLFDDGNEMDVEVHIRCNTGLPLSQSTTVSQGHGATFVVTNFADGKLDCRIWETGVVAYSVYYYDGCESQGSCTNDETACLFSDFHGGEAGTCEIVNRLQEVEVNVTKVWFDDQLQLYNDLDSQVRWACNNPATFIAVPALLGGQNHHLCNADECGDLDFSGTGGTQSFWIYPDWESGTLCSVEERISDSSVESDSSNCDKLLLWPGVGAECTIENTRFYEGIPALSQIGLAILTLLVLGVGMVGFKLWG